MIETQQNIGPAKTINLFLNPSKISLLQISLLKINKKNNNKKNNNKIHRWRWYL